MRVSIRNLFRFIFALFVFVGLFLFESPTRVDLQLSHLGALEVLAHPFGCDRLGRDHWAMLSYGALTTILITIPSRILTLLFATFVSFVGMGKNKFLALLSEVFASVFLSVPSLLVALVTIAILSDSILGILLSIVFSDWAISFETLQGKLREIRKSGFISASQALGANSSHLLIFHYIPATRNILEFLFVTGIPSVIMTIALFSYLGINTDVFSFGPGLGEQISFSKDYFSVSPLSVLLPVLGIVSLVYSFSSEEKIK